MNLDKLDFIELERTRRNCLNIMTECVRQGRDVPVHTIDTFVEVENEFQRRFLDTMNRTKAAGSLAKPKG